MPTMQYKSGVGAHQGQGGGRKKRSEVPLDSTTQTLLLQRSYSSAVMQGDRFEEDIHFFFHFLASRRVLESVTWRKPTSAEWDNGYRLVLDHFKEVKEVSILL